jgi:hypothetical protein
MAKPTTFEVTSNELKANGVPVFIYISTSREKYLGYMISIISVGN